MTKVAVWCRHNGDNIIGIGEKIPWRIPSDSRRFRNLTNGRTIVVGRKTYESFPNHTLPNRRIIVVTAMPDYEVVDADNHFVVHDLKSLKDYDEDLYISGGAGIYDSVMASSDLRPEIVVDSVYMGEMDASLSGERIHISRSIEILEQKYVSLPTVFELDNVRTTVWVKKGCFVEHSVINSICGYLETEGK